MTIYKIAVIIAGIDQSYQSTILNGIASSAAEYSFNVSAFASFSGTMGNPGHDSGELNIFQLPDFRNFDGAILLTNTIDYPPVVSDILERIKEAGIPAVSIDNDVPYLYHIGIDNKTAMRSITEHLINIHGFTKFNYISGPADNPESAIRLNAFLEVLKENDISIDDNRIFYGDFRAPSGRAAIESFIKQNLDMPQAIICANDVMAASAINRLALEGYSVPDDIAVTGFDNTYSTHNYQVELTSVDRPLALSGRLACKMLFNRLRNIPQERNVILNMSTRFTESCGCSVNSIIDLNEFKEMNFRNYSKFEKSQECMSTLNKLSCSLLGCNNFTDYEHSLKKFVSETDPEEFYFCLCNNWNSYSNETSHSSITPDIPKDYTDELIVPIAYINGKFCDPGTVSKTDILPEISSSGTGGKFYYHIPLHFGERCLGYMVIYNTKLNMNSSIFETFCINLSNSLENIRKLTCLEHAVDTLGKLYTQDSFSGIYNRNGFVQATENVYKSCIEQKRSIMLMFIDLDGLKKINDTYGHGIGDNAIRNIADVLTKSCINNEIFCRFGGDEFIIFAADYSDSDAQKLLQQIRLNISKINKSKVNPFKLSASTGYVIAKPEEGEDIFNFVTAADKIMYIEKRKKKLSRYLKG